MRQKSEAAANVSSIDKAFAIIDFLNAKGGEASINEISKGLDMHKSTVYRILNAVKAAGYIYQNEETSDYGLSMRFYQIGMRLQNNGKFLQAYAPYAEAINQKYDEVITVGVRSLAVHETPLYMEVYGYASSHALSQTLSQGGYSPCYCTATGKCLLAFSKESYLNRFDGCELPRRTQFTITNWPELRLELARIRECGYAVDNEEYEIGLTGIATPLFAPNGNIVGALSMTMPVERYRALNTAQVIADMRDISALRLKI